MYRSPRLLILLAVFSMIAGVTSGPATAADRFTDDNGSVFEADIEWMAAEGITKGCNPPANDRFCPDSAVTRGQMATFLYRALGLPLPPANADPFVDDDDSMFEAEIESLAAAGITKGCNPPTNDRFCPDAKVTREQMAAFLVRAMNYTDNGGGDLFDDDDGSTFEGDIDRLGTAGVTLGCNPPANTRFCPKSPVTRGAMAAFLHRALEPKPANPVIGTELNKLPDWGKPPTQDVAVGDPSDWIDETVGDTEYRCQTQDMNLKTAPEEIVTFDLSSEFLWPGVLLQGGDFKVGSIKELPIRQRAPLSVFVNFSDGNIRRTITNPTPGTIAAAVGDVIGDAQRSGYKPATKSVYRKTEGYNSEQMALHLGLSLKYMSASLRTSLDMERDASQHTLTVYFKENAFTANVDGFAQAPSQFFNAAFTPEILAEQERLGRISDTNLPTYVSSITYGRILMFSVTSSESISTIKAAMEGVAKWGIGSVSAEAKAEYMRVVSGNTSDIVTVGGSSAAASAAIATGDFTDYFRESTALTEYTPISYVLRDLKGNIAYLGETTDYTVETCTPVPDPPPDPTFDVKLTVTGMTIGTVSDGGDDPGDDTEIMSVVVEAQAYNRLSGTDIPGAAIFSNGQGCPSHDPDGDQPSTKGVLCWVHSGNGVALDEGEYWPVPAGESNELTITFDNTGTDGTWAYDTLALRGVTLDHDVWSGNDWVRGSTETRFVSDIFADRDSVDFDIPMETGGNTAIIHVTAELINP